MLKTHADLRKEKGLAIPSKGRDSEYIVHEDEID
jgi:hypothetical protein